MTHTFTIFGMVLIWLLNVSLSLAASPSVQTAHDVIPAQALNHWAWQPVRPIVPPPTLSSWPDDGIDRFIWRGLKKNSLSPAQSADNRRWFRRVAIDLTGLPLPVAQTQEYLHEERPDIQARIVDRLLASPSFGEHWGQHWLDVVRYAETHGQEQDEPIKNAYRYRDYVIRALNQDVPYDQFVVEHIAGDLIETPRLDQATRTNQSVQGTGFWLMTEANHIPIDLRGDEAERRENQIEVFSKAFLALTANCARCHDHKFDAISTEDYYALCGYLQSSSYQQANIADPMARGHGLDQLIKLRSRYSQELLSAYAQAIAGSRLGRYLTAALEGVANANTEALDPEILGRWVAVLQQAKDDIASPLFPILQIAADFQTPDKTTVEDTPRRVASIWEVASRDAREKMLAQKTITTCEQGERNFISSEQPWQARDLLLDYAHAGSEDWITTGLRFGRHPAQVGELLFGPNGAEPLAGIVVEAAAQDERFSERFTGILRTPTFEIRSDTLWYRFRGKAMAFLVVDSYRSGANPGSVHHGKHLFRKLEGHRDYGWQSHRVARYLGHRVHIEFMPEEDFSLSRIQFSDGEPVDSFQPNGRVVTLLQQFDPSSAVAQMADRYQMMFAEAARDLAAMSQNPLVDQQDAAQLVDWLIGHGQLLDIPADMSQKLTTIWEAYATAKAVIESHLPDPQEALALVDGSGEDEFVHHRGDHQKLASKPTPRRTLAALGGLDHPVPRRGSGRLELAQQLIDSGNPLLARVMVNRVWSRMYGQGLVRTVDDFGVMGEVPSHPELLDYLATEFLESGWSLKWLIRRMALTRTYAMTSRPRAEYEPIDPANRLLHRMALRRLPAESIRDAILTISGRIDQKMHGLSVPAYYTRRNKAYLLEQPSGPLDGAGRRSIYLEVRRNQLLEFLTTFGRPVPLTTVGQRDESPTMAQPLTLLNDPFVHEQARGWARRLLADPKLSSSERIEQAYAMALGRAPQSWETDAALAFLKLQQPQDSENDRLQAWSDLCHTLFNVKEFIFY